MERIDYFTRRLLLIIPTFLGITVVCFALTQFLPGGPVEQLLMQMRQIGSAESGPSMPGAAAISTEYRKQLEVHFGFDRPVWERYTNWLVRDRLGLRMDSYRFPNKTVWELIRERLPVSLIFGITGFVLSYLVCIPLGIAKALRHGGTFDLISSVFVFIGYAIPAIALGMVLRTLFCGTVDQFWDILPVSGFQSDNYAQLSFAGRIGDRFRHMLLPVLCYVISSFAVLTVLMKNSLLDQIGSDYIRTVLAKGASARRAIWGHALRNSLVPIVTGLGGIMTVMFAGSVIIEQMFEIPGMGRLGFEAILGRDYAVFMGTLAVTSLLALVGNLLSDFCYVLIDPRINFQKQ